MTDKSAPLANQIRQMLEAIASEPDRAACPLLRWCASTDDTEVVKFRRLWAIVCDSCRAWGPHADTQDGASKVWGNSGRSVDALVEEPE